MSRTSVRTVAAVLAALATLGILRGIAGLAAVQTPLPVLELPRVEVTAPAPAATSIDVATTQPSGPQH
jgi:hypothetical protein